MYEHCSRLHATQIQRMRRVPPPPAAPPAATPARAQTYDVLRLRVDKLAVNATRPGSNFRVVEPAGVARARGAFEVPAAGAAAVTVVVAYDA